MDSTPTNYTCLEKARKLTGNTTKGRGLALIYKTDYSCHRIRTTTDTFEALCAKFTINNGSAVVIVLLIYRPPGTPTCLFFREFASVVQKLSSAPLSSLLIIGDCNVQLQSQGNVSTAKFIEILYQLGTIQHIVQPTHRAGATLDLLVTSSKHDVYNLKIGPPNEYSDHCLIEFDFPISQTDKVRRAV